MRHDSTKALLAHWRELSRKGAPPDRNDIDPTAIASALRDVFILGFGPDGEWRYRVAGTRLQAYADRDLRGELFTGWWRPEDRFDILRLLAGAAADRTPVVGGVAGRTPRGRRHELELILLPLRHGGLDGQRLIGGLFPGPAASAHYDLRIDEIAVTSLRSLGSSPAAAPFGQPRPDIDALMERRRGLRVIEGGLA